MADQYNFSDIFVSYARADGDFVKTVVDVLFDRGYEIWIDWDDIPQTVNWWQEIQAGIDASNIFVFIVTINSANSKVCYDEVAHAVQNNKRIIPIIPDTFEDAEAETKLHPAIKMHNWFTFNRKDKSFAENIDRLIETLTLDVDYLRLHTRYLVRAREWLIRGKDTSFLLRGTDATEAQEWLELSHEKSPQPSQLQTDYISACMEQLEQDNILKSQQETLVFIDWSVIPTGLLSWLMIWYYGWQTFSEAGVEGRILIELTFGTSVTAAILFAFLILYGDVFVRLRYPNNWILRFGSSFIYSLTIGAAISGFLQVIFFGSRLEWVAVFTNAFMLSLAPMISSVFKLRGWQSVILAFIGVYAGIYLTHQTDTSPWSAPWIPVYNFRTDEQAIWLGLVMAAVLAIGMYIRPLFQDIMAWRNHLKSDA